MAVLTEKGIDYISFRNIEFVVGSKLLGDVIMRIIIDSHRFYCVEGIGLGRYCSSYFKIDILDTRIIEFFYDIILTYKLRPNVISTIYIRMYIFCERILGI